MFTTVPIENLLFQLMVKGNVLISLNDSFGLFLSLSLIPFLYP